MDGAPVFSAVSTSARQLFHLLRCISFSTNAKVQITSTGIRFTVDETRVVQGLAFVEKDLFSSYILNTEAGVSALPTFQISITALLETLQIFGLSDSSSSYRNQNGGFTSSYTHAFTTPALALGGTCRISYTEIGSPLSITIQEGAVTTSCDLNTYDVEDDSDDEGGIPLDRNTLCLKVIMRSTWLHDAIAEILGTNPTVLVINASERYHPYFALEGHGGPFGDCTVDYQPESKSEATSSLASSKKQPAVTETFTVVAPAGAHGRLRQKYKFDLIKKAGRAMAVASKVSIRQDQQGCLSLQFMIELGDTGAPSKTGERNAVGNAAEGGPVSFIDFRFVPLVDDDEDSEDRDYAADGDGHASEDSS